MAGSITQWVRLEPRTRGEPSDSGIEAGLEARVADPLWLLARQWQFGEFKGEDAGTPVIARARFDQAPMVGVRPGPRGGTAPPHRYDPARLPLEALVEREPVRPFTGRMSAMAGQHFLRLLKQAGGDRYRPAFVRAYPLTLPNGADAGLPDPASRSFHGIMAGRVPDGGILYELLNRTLRPGGGARPALPQPPAIDAADQPAVTEAALKWLAWVDTVFSLPGDDNPSWLPERQEYAFAVAANGESGPIVLEAEEYTEGHLDWYAFDHLPDTPFPLDANDASPKRVSRTVIPAPVSYKGMPSARWWELEDSQVNFGSMEAEPTDLARLVLIEFAAVYGSDWFVMPVDLEMGAVYRTKSLVVTDTFGQRLLVHPHTKVDGVLSPWRMFHPSVHPSHLADTIPLEAPPPLFIFPPVLADSLNGRPIEEVLFLRDEVANMAWAVEKRVESSGGHGVNRDEAYQARRAGAVEPDLSGIISPLVYRLASEVPEHWIPLVPAAEDTQGNIRLRRGRVITRALDAPGPAGRILAPDRPLSLFEEEVPRAGARVTRAWQQARWCDGSTHLWIGRRKGPGLGEGFSGLRYDIAEETGADPSLTVGANDLQTDAGFDASRFGDEGRFTDDD